MLADFQNSFTGRLSGKFATNIYLNIPSRFNYVATLSREIFMFKKSPCSRNYRIELFCVGGAGINTWRQYAPPPPEKNGVSIGSPVLGLAVVTNRQTLHL